MAINYSAVADGYVWHVVTEDGRVVMGEAWKRGPRDWSALITIDNGEPVITPQGGRITGYGDTRAIAVSRALTNHLHPQVAWRIATALREAKITDDTLLEVTYSLADAFKADNPHFNDALFIAAAIDGPTTQA